MTAYTGTNTVTGRWLPGGVFEVRGTYTIGAGFADTDTLTWDNILPSQDFTPLGGRVTVPELDSNGSPTLTFTIGDGSDADGYLTSTSGGADVDAELDGALIGTTVGTRDVVLTITAAPATAVTSGTIFFNLRYYGGQAD